MIKRGLFIFLVCTGHMLMACDCKEFTQEYEESISELIFLGKIIEVNNEYYQIEILESFKDKTSKKDNIYKVDIKSCSISPLHDEIWLIYGQIDNGNLEVSSCGYSRSLSFFNKSVSSKILPPRPFNYTLEEEEIVNSIYQSKVANQLYFTINTLRVRRLEEKLSNELNAGSVDKENVDATININTLLMLLNLIVLIVILLKFRTVGRNP